MEQVPEIRDKLGSFFAGDGIMDMMLKPALHTYESQDAKKGKDDGGGDEPDDD